MDTPNPTSRAFVLLEALLNASQDAVQQALSKESPEVASLVRALLAQDREGPELESALWVQGLALLVEPGVPLAPPGFELHECIGAGAMGEVFRATQAAPRRQVAIKFVLGDGLAEAQALADAQHPLIPSVFQVGGPQVGQVRPYVVMELVQGEGLRAWARDAALPDKLRLLEQLCRGVHEIHLRGVLHRDLKPANILVDASGPRLVDFGIAVGLEAADPELAGTLPYLAPEVLAGAAATVFSDVFSLGCVLVEVLSGQGAMPRAGSPSGQLSARALHPLPALPAGAQALALQALAPAPDRCPSALALAEGIAGLRRRRVWRGPIRAVVAAVLLGAVGAGLAWALAPVDPNQRALEELLALYTEPSAESIAALEGYAMLPGVAAETWGHQAWLRAAEDRVSLGLPVDAEPLAEIWAGAGPGQGHAAELLAPLLEESGGWGPLLAVAQSLDPGVEQAGYLRASAVGQRRWEDAVLEEHPLFSRLSQATATAIPAELLELDPLGGSFVAIDGATLRSGRVQEGLVVEQTFEVAAQAGLGRPHLVWGPSEPGLDGWRALVTGQGRLQVLDLGPQGWLPSFSVPFTGSLWSAAAGPDGEIYLGQGEPRGLRKLSPEGGLSVVDEGLDLANSDLKGLLVHDLDGRSPDELIVGTGPWRSYDLRVYSLGSEPLAELEERLQVGPATQPCVCAWPDGSRRLVLLKTQGGNPRLFGADQPGGPLALGLHVFAYEDGRLRETASLPIQEPIETWTGLSCGDLDGDGWPEVVGETEGQGFIASLDPEAPLVYRIAGMQPLAIGQLDGDPEMELVVRFDTDRELWALGVGSQTPPPIQAPASESRWMQLGLFEQAADQASQAAGLVSSPAAAAALLVQAADARLAQGDPSAALAALDLALERLPSAGLLAQRQALAQAALLPTPDLVPTLLSFEGALPALEWRRPSALRATPQGLEVQAVAGDGLLFSLPLVAEGGYQSLVVELEVQHAEAGAQLALGVYSKDEEWMVATLEPFGGSGQVERKWRCTLAGETRGMAVFAGAHVGPKGGSSHRARIARDGERVRCELELDETRWSAGRAAGPVPAALRLELRAQGPSPGARVDATLTRVLLYGLRPGAAEPQGWEREVVLGQLLEAADQAQGIEALELSGRLVRVQAARAGWEQVPLPTGPTLGMLRRNPVLWLDLLRSMDPELTAEWVAAGWLAAYSSGSQELVDFPWVDALSLASPDVVELLLLHGRALLDRGEVDRALRLYQRLTQSGLPDKAAFMAWQGLSVARQRAGQPGAESACAQAASRAPYPFALEDRRWGRPDLDLACGAGMPLP